MVLDASCIVAIALKEPGAEALQEELNFAPSLFVGSPTLLELAMVLDARVAGKAGAWIEQFLDEFEVEVLSFTRTHWEAAFGAWLKYGKGRHPARLNFGDCMSYAVARLSRQPLLYVGDGFARTDIKRA